MLRTTTQRVIAIGILAVAVTTVAFGWGARLARGGPALDDAALTLVRIQELTGIGPDERTHRLFASRAGFTTTLNGLGRIGAQVNGQQLADGAYHTLYVQLHDSYQRITAEGTTVSGSLSESGQATHLRIRGMIMVKNGCATPLRMFDLPTYYRYPECVREE
ncbi:MAG: hypothetical protein OQL05_02250 [Gammaproteobacteria bacterium]|nr:hypothetical protein [Gammaproteobacteria bacterium]MCW8927950.1 hypothetical protein [Gammaproteobacteria bacterium]MCW8959067.1 hypothetical protein [Gammaproteobacteria bacterium]MCW8972085.1 hypothetical protein [Gammaproteobacteria bacterium]MCW8993598.1 hypothetical protein [Gammaproteobacteria bacterium]